MSRVLSIHDIWQQDNYTFCIRWNDGHVQHFRLCDVQRQCPCAGCVDERTGERLLNAQTVSNEVRAVAIRSMGRYALHIQFTSGCSKGIYHFDDLRQM
jgi:DUF971 family protein